jgi:hypothetical protein
VIATAVFIVPCLVYIGINVSAVVVVDDAVVVATAVVVVK